MSNNSKLIILTKNIKNTFENTFENIDAYAIKLFNINNEELQKLHNPKKGQIFINFISNTCFNFYRFNGNQWIYIQ